MFFIFFFFVLSCIYIFRLVPLGELTIDKALGFLSVTFVSRPFPQEKAVYEIKQAC